MMGSIKSFETPFHQYKTIDTMVASGGCGDVYKVENEDNKIFAIKRLRPDAISEKKIKRFENELFFCLRNDCPNIITVLDFGYKEIDGKKCPFYIMPFYKNTLRSLLGEDESPITLLSIYFQILSGIKAAHKKGAIHRDIKPENILYNPEENKIVISDFGIAHFNEDYLTTSIQTKNDERLCNISYAAPEQRIRLNIEPAKTMDIFSLGLILNEMFTGSVPQGTNYKNISDVNSEYGSLDELVDEMIDNDSKKRPQSIERIELDIKLRLKTDRIIEEINQREMQKENVLYDPIIKNPIEICDFDYKNGKYEIILNQAPTQKWIEVFHRISTYKDIYFRENIAWSNLGGIPQNARIILELFKRRYEDTNREYKERLLIELQEKEAEEKREREEKIREAEKRKRVIEISKDFLKRY